MTTVLLSSLIPWCLLVLAIFSADHCSVFAFTTAPSLVATSSSSRFSSVTTSSTLRSATTDSDLDQSILAAKQVLYRAAETKQEDSDEVNEALLNLEKMMREKRKLDGGDNKTAQEMLKSLDGDWRLIFTTGTKTTQEKYGKINYFPLKAIQSFRTTIDENNPAMTIENGIYAGRFSLLKFSGLMEFNLKSCKLEFDFSFIEILGLFGLQLGKGQAAEIGSSTGLGSESNVKNIKEKDKKAFFNWISADDQIATARGGGGGVALWKRV